MYIHILSLSISRIRLKSLQHHPCIFWLSISYFRNVRLTALICLQALVFPDLPLSFFKTALQQKSRCSLNTPVFAWKLLPVDRESQLGWVLCQSVSMPWDSMMASVSSILSLPYHLILLVLKAATDAAIAFAHTQKAHSSSAVPRALPLPLKAQSKMLICHSDVS